MTLNGGGCGNRQHRGVGSKEVCHWQLGVCDNEDTEEGEGGEGRGLYNCF